MSVQRIIDEYSSEIISLNDQVDSLSNLISPLQSKINRFVVPIVQLDTAVSNLTANINQKIYDITILTNNAYNCGCGGTMYVPVYDQFGNPAIDIDSGTPIVQTVIIGSTYFYEQVKAHRINAENTSYTDVDPYGPYSGTDGSATFTTGIGYGTTVNGINQDSIIDLIINNPGSGFISSNYYRQPLSGGSGSGALADIIVGGGGTITSVVVNNGGNGYRPNEILTIAAFSGASFKITNIGSPILGTGKDTYVVASSGVGSVFAPTIFAGNISSCPTSCSTYASQFNNLQSDLSNLRAKRDALLSGINSLKKESEKLYIQRYGFIYAQGDLNSRKNNVNNIIGTLSDSTYGNYFV